MCNDQRYTESGAPIAPARCEKYIALKKENARLREALTEVQWWGPYNCQVCAWCGNEKANGHTQDCIVGNALKEVGSE